MRDTEQAILNVFKAYPSKHLETSELAREIFPEDYSTIDELIKSPDKKIANEAKRRKFQLHRKILYYLNKLIAEHILIITKIQEKGEKVFGLAIEEGDITLEKGYKKIVITKPALLTNQIETYEKQKMMKKFEDESWINRFNSILLECSKVSTVEKLYGTVKDCFNNVNDAIALNEFEILLQYPTDEWRSFIEKSSIETQNIDKTLSLIVNISNSESAILEDFIKFFAEINPKKINIIFNMTNKDMQKYNGFFKTLIEQFSKQKIKINIKNKELSIAPSFKGRAGIYTFDEEDWKSYQKNIKGRILGLSCSQSAIAVNINKFFETYQTDKEFRQAIMNAAKTLLSANTIQRRKSNEYFRSINNINSPYSNDFYRFSNNYIRFWNYDWHKDIDENKNLFELIKSTKELVDNFCLSEETIFKSCGIPIRFRIFFSSAFRNFDSVFMGEREYKKATVKSSEDFYKGDIKKFISIREKLFDIFDGGDRLRIFRSTEFVPEDIMHEWSIILSAYKVPFFTYDFSGLKGMVKLTNFI
jgi:hypothetical protein